MNTQVIFKIDKKLKDKAMKKAQNDGMPFATVLKLATKAFVDGALDVSLVSRPKLNAKTRKMLDRELKETREGKNISPGFSDVESAIAYLRAL